ncbi:MAG: hypothetical protein DI528_00580 [Shinella sp.]|nr:MAG: hypothetical protein DI528_00580 [Shinella sp.]
MTAPAITTVSLLEAFSEIAAAMTENRNTLSRVDSIDGDGDHGETMTRVFRGVETNLAKLEPSDTTPSELFDIVAENLMTFDATSARLYASAFRRAGTATMRKKTLTSADFAKAFKEMAAGIAAHGKTGIETKNIADIWQVAAAAYAEAAANNNDPAICLTAALEAAEDGVETDAMIRGADATFVNGRRPPDAGALSALLMIRALRDSFR